MPLSRVLNNVSEPTYGVLLGRRYQRREELVICQIRIINAWRIQGASTGCLIIEKWLQVPLPSWDHCMQSIDTSWPFSPVLRSPGIL